LDMIALSIAALGQLKAKRIGMLASPAVRMVGLIEQRLKDTGYEPVFPANDAKLLNVIKAVKAGRTGDAERAATTDVARSLDVDAYLIACTELSVLTPMTFAKPHIDTLDVLVAATIAEATGRSA